MDYQSILKLNQEIKSFRNANLFSIVDDKSIIVENTKTKAKFLIPYEENKSGFVFRCDEGELIEKGAPTPHETFIENSNKLLEGITNIFSENHKHARGYLKEVFNELPFVTYEDTTPEPPVKKYKTPKLTYFKKFQKSFNEMEAAKQEFFENNSLFTSSESLNRRVIFSSKVIEQFQEAHKMVKDFGKHVKQYSRLRNELVKHFNEEVAQTILSKIDFTEQFDIKAKASKILVEAKQKHEDLNIVDGAHKMNQIFESASNIPVIAKDYIYNYHMKSSDVPKFLKFRTGEFSVADVIAIAEEMEGALRNIGELNDEDMMYIADKQTMLEYMLRTHKVSDAIVKQIIEDFNKRFAGTTDDDYIASEMGFKSKEEQITINPQGIEASEGV